MATKKKTSPSWIDVKAKLIDFDRTAVLNLLQDLYVANKDNQAFLHARLLLGDDALKPYKVIIERWLWPDVSRNQDISLAKATKAIADYKKASGTPEGLAELMVFYCEQAAGFSNEVGLDEGKYYAALLRMFEQALNTIATLPLAQRPMPRSRLDVVRQACRNIGHGVGDAMTDLLAAQ